MEDALEGSTTSGEPLGLMLADAAYELMTAGRMIPTVLQQRLHRLGVLQFAQAALQLFKLLPSGRLFIQFHQILESAHRAPEIMPRGGIKAIKTGHVRVDQFTRSRRKFLIAG